SIIDNNGRDRTGVSLSTQIIVKVGNTAVGAIQKLSIRENKTITMVNEVGTDGAIDSSPTSSSQFSGEVRRIRFDRLRITEAFSRGFLHVHAQRIPFDIVIFDNWGGDGANSIITTIKNVWVQSLSYQYAVDSWLITDDMSFVAETMYSNVNGNQNAANGGERGVPLQLNSVERLADRGGLRGSLDQPGLLTDFFSNV